MRGVPVSRLYLFHGQKPILPISIYHTAHDFFEIKPLIESWGLGYRFSIHKPALTYGGTISDTVLVAETDA